jgi:hypothetical protein
LREGFAVGGVTPGDEPELSGTCGTAGRRRLLIRPSTSRGVLCRNDYAFHEHRVWITLPEVGPARLRVVGLRASTQENMLDSVEVGVDVRSPD